MNFLGNCYRMRSCKGARACNKMVQLKLMRISICILIFAFDKFVASTKKWSFNECCLMNETVAEKCDDNFKLLYNGNANVSPCASVATSSLNDSTNCLEFHRNKDENKQQVVQPVVLRCPSFLSGINRVSPGKTMSIDSSEILPEIVKIKRCCFDGQLFDSSVHSCLAEGDREESDFLAFVTSNLQVDVILNVTRGFDICDGAALYHRVESKDLYLENGQIWATIDNLEDPEVIEISDPGSCVELSTTEQDSMIVRTCKPREFCNENPCIRKCCPEDSKMVPGECEENGLPGLFHQALANHSDRLNNVNYGILTGKPCHYGMYTVYENESWGLTAEGYLKVPGYSTYGHNNYCLDVFYNSPDYDEYLYPFACFDAPDTEEVSPLRFSVNAGLELLSCMFLLMTLLVYACLPSLRNLHGKTLMCHVSSLFLAYGCLAIVTIATPDHFLSNAEEESTIVCKLLGYTIVFSFLSAFSWLNVMCFDIWWTFGGLPGGNTIHKGRRHTKRFLLYCLYAWGAALFITTLSVLADHMDGMVPHFQKPHIGIHRCWFKQGEQYHGEILFFIGPISFQLIINVIFFVLTSINCSKVKAEIGRAMTSPSDPKARRFEADKTILIMNAKLFVVMGISWVMEMISAFLNHYAQELQWRQEFFYVSDVFNCLQGVLIFVLFVLKNKVYVALKRRLGKNKNKRINGISQGGTTTLHELRKVSKCGSCSTLTSTFAVNALP